jgi:two-component system sensor histidine kinase UhpB
MLTNAIRHSEASRVQVELVRRGDCIALTVADDGLGFVVTEVGPERFGILGLRERTEALGGALQLDTAPGRGTRATLSLPA